MRCPACSCPATETDAACRQCGFTLEMADQAFGMPPILHPPVADVANVLTRTERTRIMRAANGLQHRFPQVSVAVVTCAVPAQAPLPVYAFWLFNRASLFSAVEKAGDNRGLLLLIDPDRGEIGLMIGYGLEPFIPEDALSTAAAAAASLMQDNLLAEAAIAGLTRLEEALSRQSQSLPLAFGLLEPEDARTADTADLF